MISHLRATREEGLFVAVKRILQDAVLMLEEKSVCQCIYTLPIP